MSEGLKLQQVGHAARVNEHSVYIKIVNAQSKNKCIVVWSDNPGWVYGRK